MTTTGSLKRSNEAAELPFPTSGPRRIKKLEAYPWRWPKGTKGARVAAGYVRDWKAMAETAFGQLCISRATVREIASHISRRTGELRLTDAMLSARSGRAVVTTGRDIRRLKDLGLIETRYEAGKKGRERVRVITIAFPMEAVVPSTPPRLSIDGGPINGVYPVDDVDI